jgi:MoaA/NifB/PqqE/SkfB family radical SAM enzyme
MAFLCDLPWVHFSIFPHGTTSVCCETEHRGAMGHGYNIDENGQKNILGIKDNSIDDIVNSDNYKRIRREMLEGKVPDACRGCKKIEDAGGKSKRQKDSYWMEDWSKVTQSDGTIKPDLRSIELRLGNYCNLRCRSCNAESSTSWIKEYNQLKDTLPLASNFQNIQSQSRYSFDWPETDEFYDDLLQYLDNIEELHISGGEPFLVPKHFKLLEILKQRGKTDLHIGYHTNLNYNLDKIMPSLKVLKEFSNVRLNLSIDDVGERNTYIRNPSNWKLTIDNLQRLQQELPDTTLLICQTINVYNFLYIEELYEYLQSIGVDLYQYYNHVHSPDYQTAYIIPSDIRKQKIDSIKGKINDRLYEDLYGRYYNDLDYSESKQVFKNFTGALDKTRSENFAKVFPLLQKVLDA